jgi:hypothetical protein
MSPNLLQFKNRFNFFGNGLIASTIDRMIWDFPDVTFGAPKSSQFRAENLPNKYIIATILDISHLHALRRLPRALVQFRHSNPSSEWPNINDYLKWPSRSKTNEVIVIAINETDSFPYWSKKVSFIWKFSFRFYESDLQFLTRIGLKLRKIGNHESRRF